MFFAHTVEELRNPERRFTLSPEDIALLNPNTRTCPIFRSRKDAELTKAIYRRAPVLIREPRDGRPAENPWGIRFSTMFHMSNDSQLFHTREQLEAEGWVLDGNVFLRDGAEYLPLYEAKMIHHYNHRWATLQDGEAGEPSPAEAEEPGPDDTVQPRYRVDAREVYLRTADLPKELLNGLRDRNTPAIVQSVAHLLFAHWLWQELDDPAEMAAGELSSAWKRFTELHPFARDLTVMQSNPRGNGPASISFIWSEQSAARDAASWHREEREAPNRMVSRRPNYRGIGIPGSSPIATPFDRFGASSTGRSRSTRLCGRLPEAVGSTLVDGMAGHHQFHE